MRVCKVAITAFLLGCPLLAYAKFDLKSIRSKISRPATVHNLVFKDPSGGRPTTFFDLEPKNNERLGLFVKINSLLLGYSLDVFKANQETATTHIDFISEHFNFSRLGFNIQVLKGFDSKARSIETNQIQRRFFPGIRSERLEFFGLHNLKTFYGTSLFNHFFLNRPTEGSDSFGLSLVGGWTLRHLKLNSKNGVIYTPSFFESSIDDLAPEIKALSASVSAGPMLSIGLKSRFSMFIETKFGLGIFENLTETTDLKKSGLEFLQSYGAGFSWNSSNKDVMLNSGISYQRGRHIRTFFGDVTLLFFF